MASFRSTADVFSSTAHPDREPISDSSSRPARPRETGKSGRVLVVDDEEIVREVLDTLLRGENYEVDLAEDGPQALARVRENDYAVVLLDLMMPEMDGFRVLEDLRKLDAPPKALILTAFGSIDRAVKATKLGPDPSVGDQPGTGAP
ncbi:MAG: response regulator [Betaproteobacteria bacterium]|nr:response regulator [Betaproteobacteria bacterium]